MSIRNAIHGYLQGLAARYLMGTDCVPFMEVRLDDYTTKNYDPGTGTFYIKQGFVEKTMILRVRGRHDKWWPVNTPLRSNE